jgi:hypothetical protein
VNLDTEPVRNLFECFQARVVLYAGFVELKKFLTDTAFLGSFLLRPAPLFSERPDSLAKSL